MKILHTADIHHDPKFSFNTLPAMRSIVALADRADPDAVVIAGDLFHNRDKLDPTSVYEMRLFVEELTISARGTRPVIIVPGNHDATNSSERIDSVSAVFEMPETVNNKWPSRFAGVQVFATPMPRIIETLGGSLVVNPLPTPNKYHYRSFVGNNPTNEQMAEALAHIIANFERCHKAGAPKFPSILVYHGTISGGLADSEQVMTTGLDIAISQESLSGFDAVMCGHLHRHQKVGEAIYCGSPTALNFHQQEPYFPGVVMWDLNAAAGIDCEFIELDVAHRFYQFEYQDADYGLVLKQPEKLAGAIIKVTGEIDGSLEDARQDILAAFPQALEVKPEIKRKAIETSDIKIDLAEPIEELLKRWLAIQEITDVDEVSRVCGLAGKVRKQIGVDKLAELEAKTFEPIDITLSNWCQIRAAYVDFQALPKLVNLTGDNKSGKSNLAGAEPFALFGWIRPGSTIKDHIRAGETKASVLYRFKSRGREYMIERSLKRAPSGRVTGDVYFAEIIKGKEESRNEADANGTNLAIVDIVGGVDAYFRTVFARQNKIDDLLDMKPAEMKTTVQTALGAQKYWHYQQAAKSLKAALEKDLAGVSDGIRRNAERIGIEAAVGAEIETLAGQVNELEKLNKDDKASRAEAEAAISQKTEMRAELTARLKTYAAINQEIDGYKRERDRFIESIKKLNALEEHRGEIEAKLKEIDNLEALDRELEIKSVEDARIKKEIDSIARDIETEREKLKRAADRLKEKIERAEKDAERLENVPCQDSENFSSDPTARQYNFPEDFSGCRFLVDAVKARDSLPELRELLGAAKAAFLNAATGDLKKKIKLEDERAELGYDILRHKGAGGISQQMRELRTQDWNHKNIELAAAAARRQAAEEARQAAEDRITKAAAKRETFEVNEEQYDELKAHVDSLGQEKAQLDKMIELRMGTIVEKNREIGARQERLDQAAKAAAENKELETRQLFLAQEITALEHFINATGRNGIPFLKLREAVPRLEQLANDLLGDAPVSIVIDPERELSTGEIADELAVRFRDYRGDFALSMASGFDRFMLGLALRYALALIEAESSGASVKGFWIDEGFGVIREDNLAHAREMLVRIAADFERVIFITHIEPLKVIAETQIQLIDGADGSEVIISA